MGGGKVLNNSKNSFLTTTACQMGGGKMGGGKVIEDGEFILKNVYFHLEKCYLFFYPIYGHVKFM